MIQAVTSTIDDAPAEALPVRVEIGRTMLSLNDVTQLRAGSVVTLDTPAGGRANIYVAGRLTARGEVVVVDGNFCVRVTELVAYQR